MYKIKIFLLCFLAFFALLSVDVNGQGVTDNFFCPLSVVEKAKELNFGFDNIVVLYNSDSNEFYIPFQSVYDSNMSNLRWTVTNYGGHFILVNSCWQKMGLYIYNPSSDSFRDASSEYVYYTGKQSSLILDDVSHPLDVVYSSFNVVYRSDWSTIYFDVSNNCKVVDSCYSNSDGFVFELDGIFYNIPPLPYDHSKFNPLAFSYIKADGKTDVLFSYYGYSEGDFIYNDNISQFGYLSNHSIEIVIFVVVENHWVCAEWQPRQC